MRAGKSLFRAANVWWRCIVLLPLVARLYRCLETIDVCIWRMFVFIVVTVWGSVGMFVV